MYHFGTETGQCVGSLRSSLLLWKTTEAGLCGQCVGSSCEDERTHWPWHPDVKSYSIKSHELSEHHQDPNPWQLLVKQKACKLALNKHERIRDQVDRPTVLQQFLQGENWARRLTEFNPWQTSWVNQFSPRVPLKESRGRDKERRNARFKNA